MSNGLDTRMPEISAKLKALREKGQDVSLRQILKDDYKMEPGHLYSDFQFDPNQTRLKDAYIHPQGGLLVAEVILDGIRRGMKFGQVISESGGARYVSPESIGEPVNRGAVQGGFYNDLIFMDESIDSLAHTMPLLDLSAAAPRESGEGVTIEEGSVSYKSKTVVMKKRGRGLKATYESLQFNSLNFVSRFFEDMGVLLAVQLNNDAVNTLVSGEQASAAENAATIGVASTGSKLQYKDLTRAFVRLGLLGRTGQFIIANEDGINYFLNMNEIINRKNSGPQFINVRFKTPVPTDLDAYTSVKVAAGQYIIGDRDRTMVKLTAQPVMIETERIVAKQIQGAYATTYTGFAIVQRNGRVIIDETVAFNSNQWPTWMSPYAE
jgi:hypothetical protein